MYKYEIQWRTDNLPNQEGPTREIIEATSYEVNTDKHKSLESISFFNGEGVVKQIFSRPAAITRLGSASESE